MPVFDSKAQNNLNVLIVDKTHPFEIEEVNVKRAQSGNMMRVLKLGFYQDETFKVRIASWEEVLVDTSNAHWKWCVFAKCVSFPVIDGTEFDIDEKWTGYRGWAFCSAEESKTKRNEDGTFKKYNRVQSFLTDKPKLSPAEKSPNFD